MCGIAGLVLARCPDYDVRAAAVRMADCQRTRGPDSSGVWVEEELPVALAHRRLAIIDLSESGHQPMVSPSGRYVVSYNGEIYNYREIRAELEARGRAFAGHSDTEVLLAAVEEWDLEPAIRRCSGIFALGVWDRQSRTLSLVRDRVGVKPLYYAILPNGIVFASQVDALLKVPDFAPRIEAAVLPLYLRHGYIPAPHSIFQRAFKLLPGHILTAKVADSGVEEPRVAAYWSLKDVAEAGLRTPAAGEVEDVLHSKLRKAVLGQTVSDVPLGTFLSGGIDSTLVTALLQSQVSQPVRTFTIGFDVPEFDEAPHARAVARHLGTQHTELYVGMRELLDTVSALPELCDEPFADSSLLPTYLLSKLTRRSVTVSLSGDGGDELFFGYNLYAHTLRLWQLRQRIPRALRRAVVAAAGAAGTGAQPAGAIGRAMRWAAGMCSPDTEETFYRHVISGNRTPGRLLLDRGELPCFLTDASRSLGVPHRMSDYMPYADCGMYLPDDILTKVDRASMAVSLEARVPLLDHEIVEYAWSIPHQLKVRQGQRKWILRQILGRYVPASLYDRPKRGFGVPLNAWLRGPLRPWAEDLLSTQSLSAAGVFDTGTIRELWAEHSAGGRNRSTELWPVIVFQAWRSRVGL